jgi:signal transduction histidine kinase
VVSPVATRPELRRSVRVLSRFAAPTHRLGFWIALWALAGAIQIVALLPVIRGQALPGWDVIFRLVGGSFAACGLVAWRRRPDSHSGRLMYATGIASFAYPVLFQIHAPVGVTGALLLGNVWTIVFVALLLTYMTDGRLRSRTDRRLVGAYVVTLLILQGVWLSFVDVEGNLLLAFPGAGVVGIVGNGLQLLAARWRAASAPRRRALLPTAAGAVCLLMSAVLVVEDIGSKLTSEPLVWLTNASLFLVPATFLAGLLHSRLARGGLADLFRELRTARGDDLQAALARTLGDPQLAVAYRVADGFAAADGTPLALPADRAVLPIRLGDREVAALVYDPALDDDPALVEAAAAATTIALETDQLHAESQARSAELQESRQRIVQAGDAERWRLERNLHDGAQQRLLALSLQLQLIQDDIRSDPSAAEARVTSVSDELSESLEELRELARGLHPALLEHGLTSALASLASRSPVPTTVTSDELEPVPRPVELALYFVASEALANVAKHAAATTASVRLIGIQGGIAIEIADDGAGGAEAAGGSGLRGLADRVEALGGHLLVTSPPGAGTVITAELPCAS